MKATGFLPGFELGFELADTEANMTSHSCKIYFRSQATTFLREIINRCELRPITVIVCSTREHFLERLVAIIRNTADGVAVSEDQQLLTRAIGLLSKSRKTKLVFCPSVESLRACISVLEMASAKLQEESQRPVLAVLDLLSLHRSPAEFTAQGISRTLAAMVEVTSRQGVDVELCECMDSLDGGSSLRGQALWNERVPLANGSTSSGTEDGILKGRLVSPRKIAQRWFIFDADNGRTGDEQQQ